jgi:hypothetical protein
MEDYMTRHAEVRRLERAVRTSDCQVFQNWADVEEPFQRGAVRVKLSAEAAKHAAAFGVSHSQIERLRRLVFVVKGGKVLTLYRRPAKRSVAAWAEPAKKQRTQS